MRIRRALRIRGARFLKEGGDRMAVHGGGTRYLTEEDKKKYPRISKELIGRILGLIRPYRGQLALALLCVAAVSVLNLIPPVLTGIIIDQGLIGHNLDLLIRMIALSFAIIVAANLVALLQTYLSAWIAQHISFDLRNQLFAHLEQMPQQFFVSRNQGDIITRMTSDIDGVESVVETTFTNILSNVITLIAALTIMFQKNVAMAFVGILVIPLFILPTRKVGKIRWNLRREAQARQDKINGILGETLSVSGQLLVKLFSREDYEYDRYSRQNREMIGLNIREKMAGRWFRMAIGTFSSAGPMLIYLVGGILLIRGGSALTVGDITVLVALLGKMYGPVNQLLNIQVDWIRSMASFTRIFSSLDLPVSIRTPENAIIPENASGRVSFSHVHFSYDRNVEILKDISFTLNPGSSMALVGASGAGKSSIIQLIPRLYDVTEGSVSFEGVDVRKLDLAWLRENVGIVTQDTYLFNGTLRENLLYARPEATEEDLIKACRQADIYHFIEKLPKRFDTLVGNRGLELSGGERQRVSIARVLLKDPSLLIFDEATSSLDSISEASIQKAINPLISTRTSIIIAHRLSTIQSVDMILVIKEGRIVERGSHKELLEKNGAYARLYRTQYEKEKRMTPEEQG